MVKPAQGFMSDDGNFFDTEAEAEHHEAETNLMMVLGSSYLAGDAIDTFMEHCVTHKAVIRRYLDAYEAINQQEETTISEHDKAAAYVIAASSFAEARRYSQDNTAGSQADASLQPLADNRHSDVSDVGGSPRSEAVQDDTTRDGP